MADGKTILIAEDDKFLASAYKVKLDKAGYNVVIAKDGEEAMTFLKDNVPSLMLLDLIMPKKDGFSVLKDARADDRLKDVPILISSNLSQKEDIDKGMELGASGYITKSDISMEDLLERIKSLVG